MISFSKKYSLSIFAILAVASFVLSSCDAYLSMPYIVRNKTKQTLLVHVESYPIQSGMYADRVDTMILLRPKQNIYVGWNQGIGFPTETRKLFREQRGVENFKIVSPDSAKFTNPDQKNWIYRNGCSIFLIKLRK